LTNNHNIADFLNQHPLLDGFVRATLPTAAYSLFMVTLPYLLRYMISFGGYWYHSDSQRQLIRIYWVFIFVIPFLGYIFAGSFITIASLFVADPVGAVDQLGGAVSLQAVYFANYMVFEGWAGYMLFWLLRVDELLITLVLRIYYVTPEDRRWTEEAIPFGYGILFPRQLMVMLIAIVYSTMAPYVVIVATSYLAFSWFSAKYNIIYVSRPQTVESKTSLTAITCVTFILFFYQLAMIGIFVLKAFPAGLAVTSLAVFSVGYFFYNWYRSNKAPREGVSHYQQTVAPNEVDARKFVALFHHPALTEPDRAHKSYVTIGYDRTFRQYSRRYVARRNSQSGESASGPVGVDIQVEVDDRVTHEYFEPADAEEDMYIPEESSSDIEFGVRSF